MYEYTNFTNLIQKNLRNFGDEFKAGELAFLSLAGKSENHLRDRLAFALHKRLKGGLLVSKEWKRHDIALLQLNNPDPHALFELKVFYTFDAVVPNKLKRLKSAIIKDRDKLTQHIKCQRRFILIFVVHPEREIPKHYFEVVAYAGRINKAYRNNGGAKKVKERCRKNIGKFFQKKDFKKVVFGELRAGSFAGIKDTVFYWLARV